MDYGSMIEVHKQTDHDGRPESVLIIGDVDGSLVAGAAGYGCRVYSNVLDGIDAAGSDSLSVIAVALAGPQARLASVLKALRLANPAAKILMLARMHQEPDAAAIVAATHDGSRLADDYVICPTTWAELLEARRPKASPVSQQTVIEGIADDEGLQRIEHLESLATEDDLTGLKNRRYVWEFARQVIQLAAEQDTRVTLLVFDIDDFKHYNDTYDHSTGDRILREAAVLMKRCCREHDVVGRIGGDEFAVVFWDDSKFAGAVDASGRRSARADHPREAIFIAKRFRCELESAELDVLGPFGKGELTISGGLASFPRDGSTIVELFQRADEALLAAKRSGKNQIHLVGRGDNDIGEIE